YVLQEAYQTIAGKVSQEAHGKRLTYPSLMQLKIETLYVSYPWIPILILLYAVGAVVLLMSDRHNLAMGLISLAILCHTTLLALRCYILERPPVSNMFETLLYVPWVAACITLLFPFFRRQTLVLFAACVTSISLLL